MTANDERAEKFVRECERCSGAQLPANLVEELSAMLSASGSAHEQVGFFRAPSGEEGEGLLAKACRDAAEQR